MYFASRTQAGRQLATKLAEKYRYENCAVMALSDGGVVVGAQLAIKLHCVLTMLLSSEIKLPREPDALAAITQSGSLAYNSRYSAGEVDELVGEYRNLLEQQKMLEMHKMNILVGSGGTIKRELLNGQNIIVVSDGLAAGFAVDLAYEFLKPVDYDKLIFATPFASVKAVDRMHVLADDLYCLNVLEEIPDVNHYYEKNDVPDHQMVVETIEQIILKWK